MIYPKNTKQPSSTTSVTACTLVIYYFNTNIIMQCIRSLFFEELSLLLLEYLGTEGKHEATTGVVEWSDSSFQFFSCYYHRSLRFL